MKGIFEIRRHESDPNQDTLRWCFGRPTEPRPTSFSIEEGTGQTFVELQRYIVDEDKLVAKLRNAGATIYKDNDGGWVTEIVLPASFDSKVAFETIPNLRKLSSVVSYVADKELINGLTSHPTVRSLRFRCEVTPAHLDQLASNLPNLQTLGFCCKELTEAHCRAIKKGKSIHSLKIGGNEGDLSALKLLEGLPIRSLSLFDCKLSQDSFGCVAEHMAKLGWLNISNSQLSVDALVPINQLKGLYTLELKGKTITDEHLLAIKAQPHFRTLTISDTAVSNSSLKHILEEFPKVFSVRAENVAFDSGIFQIVSTVAQDRQFRVTVSNSSISREEIEGEAKDISERISVIGNSPR